MDLKTDDGQALLVRLARDADVLLESFRPGVLERLGVGYEPLSQQNPGLVYCAITGYGQHGPNHDRAGHNINYLALNGILGLTWDADGPGRTQEQWRRFASECDCCLKPVLDLDEVLTSPLSRGVILDSTD